MKRMALTVASVACVPLFLFTTPSMADSTATTKPATTSSPLKNVIDVKLTGDFQEMAKVEKLDHDTQVKLSAINADQTAAMKKFDDAHAGERNQLKATLKQAQASGSNDLAMKTHDSLVALDAQERKTAAPFMDAAVALLTHDQQNDWKLYKLTKEIISPFHGLKLTDDQMSQTKTLAASKLAAFIAAGDDDKARKAILMSLRETFEKTILTSAQMAAIQHDAANNASKQTATMTPSATKAPAPMTPSTSSVPATRPSTK